MSSTWIAAKMFMCQLLECMNDWIQSYDLGDSTDVIYLDIAKAFDTVAQQRLLAKLDHSGIRGH